MDELVAVLQLPSCLTKLEGLSRIEKELCNTIVKTKGEIKDEMLGGGTCNMGRHGNGKALGE
jgi:hypothetical protein